MSIRVNHSIVLSSHVDDIVNHPDGSEEDDDDEKHLQVMGADVDVAVGSAAGQRTAQHQDVDKDDPRQQPPPAPNATLLPDPSRVAQVGLTRSVCLTQRSDVVGQVGLLHLPISDRHPAWFTRFTVCQTVALVSSVKTHLPLSLKVFSLLSCLLHLASYETLQV